MKTAEEKLKEAVEDYTLNGVDYNIRAFQNTEVPALIDLAHDSFENGYRKALAEHDSEIISKIDEMRKLKAIQHDITMASVKPEALEWYHRMHDGIENTLTELKQWVLK